MKFAAFSLIELMVVIAIIAVLAAIAVPAYQNYLIGSRLGSAFATVNEIMDRSIEFSATHGRFGNAGDLGLASTDTYLIDDPTSVSKYFTFMYVTDSSPYPPCGQYGEIFIKLDPVLMGFAPGFVDSPEDFTITCDYWHYNGTIDRICGYKYGSSSRDLSYTTPLVPGVMLENADSAYFDVTNFGNYENDHHYNDAICQ